MRKFALVFLCSIGLYYLVFLAIKAFTDVGVLAEQYPKVIYDGKTKERTIEIVPRAPASWVSLGQVSSIAVAAILISEDSAFYQHQGFDWSQIRESFETNWREGRFARGGSTITQQVVKNVFLTNEKTVWRKLQEAILAVRIERQLKKRRILEVYLNIAEFGQGLYGIGPAARFYFGKSPASLSAKEGAFLAMLLPSPKKYSVSFRKKELTPYARSTVRSILAKLWVTKRLTEEEYRSYLVQPLSFEAAAAAPIALEGETILDEEPEGGESFSEESEPAME
jgi:monofunctional glycosyltransferase